MAKPEAVTCSRLLREPALFSLSIILLISFALFPRGYMPARTANGFTITLCSAAGLEKRAVGESRRASHVGSVKCDILGAGTAVLAAPAEFHRGIIAGASAPSWAVLAAEPVFRSSFDPNAPPTAPPLPRL